MSRVFIAFSLFLMSEILSAQICGTPQAPLLDRTDINKKSLQILQRGVEKYIPLTFHLVADSDSNGAIQVEDVFRQLCNLNAQFDDQEVTFYIDRLNYIYNTAVYNTPASSAATVQMRLRKDNNSINIFITNKADSGSGTPGEVLAYYDPSEDWIVSKKGQINGASSTLGHELGHFFSLPHPHAGWDCYPYTTEDYTNPINVDYTIPCDGGGGSVLIELQNGTNCNTAGDRICDTPPDYNIGLLHQNGCAPNTSVKDKNGQVITPITNNFMSYYRDCDTYTFTNTQKNLMNTDFFTVQRSYIRTGKVPNTDSIEAPVQYISPINGELTNSEDNILLDWEDTPGATHYLLIIDRFPSFTNNPQKFFVTESEFVIDGLTPLQLYYWKVWPYNESQTCALYSPTQNFRVGTGVAVNEIKDINNYIVSPNPITSDMYALLTLSSVNTFEGEVSITDATGHLYSKNAITVPAGVSQHQLQTQGFAAGIYFVILHSKNGILVERLLIM